ncbi:hypothetical protein RR46_07091 [Papilio xuthus]|uniref:VWFA domain-containing protein n=1 Tax=Papilio xuthus TaxID=66420 RepID=A0A194QAQ4_PAPXU|nr:hypothetical protein RR46_07091 [Papilio xuthus]
MASLRDKLTIVLVIYNILSVSLSEIEVNYDINGDVTNEHYNKTQETDNEAEKYITNEDATEANEKTNNTNKVDIETEYEIDTSELNITVETTTAVIDIPEALGLKTFANVDYEYSQPNKNVDDKIDGLTDADGTEVTEASSLSTIDNNVYKFKDIVPEDMFSSHSGREDDVTETTVSATTKATDETISNENQLSSTGQRIPKTDNSEAKQPIEKRNDAKPRSTVHTSKSSTLRSWLEDTWLRPPAGVLVPLRPRALQRALDVWKDLTADGSLKMTDIVIVGFDSKGISWRSRHNLQASGTTDDKTVGDAISKLIVKYQGVRSESASDGTLRALASAAKLVPYDSALFLITDKEVGDPLKLPLALRALVEKRLKVYTIWTDPNYPSIESELSLVELRNVSTHTEGDVLPYSLQAKELENGIPPVADLQQWEPLAEAQLGPRRARLRQIEEDSFDELENGIPPVADLQQWEPLAEAQLGPRRARLRQIEEDSFDTLLIWRGGGEAISLGIPVEAGVAALRILIEGDVDHAALFPPNEAPQVDLFNETSVKQFSSSSRTDGLVPRDVYLPFPGAPQIDVMHGKKIFSLPMHPLIRKVHFHFPSFPYKKKGGKGMRTKLGLRDAHSSDCNSLNLRVIGPVASVRESSLVDEYGTELAKLPFSYPASSNTNPAHINLVTEIEEAVPLPKLKVSRVYAKILGRNIQGDPFIRFSGPIDHEIEVRNGRSAVIFPNSNNDLEGVEEENIHMHKMRLNETNALPYGRTSRVVQQGTLVTALIIGLGSRLYGSPGDSLQLHFEVSNYREQAVRFSFGATGELRFLRSIEPSSQTIQSGQTLNVIVNLLISTAAQPGVRDFITFTAYGLDQISISAYVYVVNPNESQVDQFAPEVRHSYQGHCIGRMGNDCAEHTWSATVYARDSGGLLRITSTPLGLMAAQDRTFISGTREEVVTVYRSTCCSTRVVVNAVDIYGNTNSYTMDISSKNIPNISIEDYITDAGIAAIVLGVLLIIALIAIIIFLITWCVRKRKSSRELPSYASRNVS